MSEHTPKIIEYDVPAPIVNLAKKLDSYMKGTQWVFFSNKKVFYDKVTALLFQDFTAKDYILEYLPNNSKETRMRLDKDRFEGFLWDFPLKKELENIFKTKNIFPSIAKIKAVHNRINNIKFVTIITRDSYVYEAMENLNIISADMAGIYMPVSRLSTENALGSQFKGFRLMHLFLKNDLIPKYFNEEETKLFKSLKTEAMSGKFENWIESIMVEIQN